MEALIFTDGRTQTANSEQDAKEETRSIIIWFIFIRLC